MKGEIAAGAIAKWRESPVSMVRELFETEPDHWQVDVLDAFPNSPRLAMKACVGPGKTAVLAWLGWNFLLTRPFPIVGATSTSGANLKTNLWTELARWRERAPLLKSQFEMTKTEIFHKKHPQTWKLEARTWPKDANPDQIGSSLAGIHSAYVMWLLDESGDYPDAIMPVCEGIFSGSPKEAHIVQAGNPLKRSGPLYRACYTARNLWKVVEITGDPDDPKRSPRISVDHARAMIAQYGIENPWVMVRILGKFPPSDINALIGEDEVRAAMARFYRPFEIGSAAKVLGVDVAREGDDASVIASRQGVQAFPFEKHRNIDSTQGAGRVARKWNDWGADGCFIDATGGFGSGWIDQLRNLGKAPFGVQFAGEAHNKSRYYNKRAEMAFDFVEWVKRGGALPLPDGQAPELSELFQALTQTTYSFRGDRFLLEDKKQLKDRLGFSPDEMDAYMLTFAEPVTSPKAPPRGRSMQANYDPFREMNLETEVERSYGSRHRSDFDPFQGG